jgi:hypothetical protein
MGLQGHWRAPLGRVVSAPHLFSALFALILVCGLSAERATASSGSEPADGYSGTITYSRSYTTPIKPDPNNDYCPSGGTETDSEQWKIDFSGLTLGDFGGEPAPITGSLQVTDDCAPDADGKTSRTATLTQPGVVQVFVMPGTGGQVGLGTLESRDSDSSDLSPGLGGSLAFTFSCSSGLCHSTTPWQDVPYIGGGNGTNGVGDTVPVAASGISTMQLAVPWEIDYGIQNTEPGTLTVNLIPPGPPVNTTPPSILGTPTAGIPTQASVGGWRGQVDSYSWQWNRCDASGGNCAAIAGANGSTYTPTDADAGSTLTLTETARNNYGTSDPVTSAPSGVAQPAPEPTPPGPSSALAPPVARCDVYRTPPKQKLHVAAPGVLANDSSDGHGALVPSVDHISFGVSSHPYRLTATGALTFQATKKGVATITYHDRAVDGSVTQPTTVTIYIQTAALTRAQRLVCGTAKGGNGVDIVGKGKRKGQGLTKASADAVLYFKAAYLENVTSIPPSGATIDGPDYALVTTSCSCNTGQKVASITISQTWRIEVKESAATTIPILWDGNPLPGDEWNPTPDKGLTSKGLNYFTYNETTSCSGRQLTHVPGGVKCTYGSVSTRHEATAPGIIKSVGIAMTATITMNGYKPIELVPASSSTSGTKFLEHTKTAHYKFPIK